jgi:hypothetical protein
MDARNELLAYLGASIVTVVALFGLQAWYASYLDVAVVHAQPADTPLNEKVSAIRAQEQQKLSSGKRPIDEAKRMVAGGNRASLTAIAPKQSEDLTPMSGWISRPGFKAYEPRTSQPSAPAAAPQGEAAAPADGAVPAAAQPAGAPAGAQPAGAQPAQGDKSP